MTEFAGRVAVITGGTSGIGLETAIAFARAGAAVESWDRHLPVEPIDGIVHREVDVTATASVRVAAAAALAQHGRIDILINNAGIVKDAQLVKVKDGAVVGEMSEADFDAVLAVNLTGVFRCTQAVVPAMIAQGYGRIVSASSVVGLYGNFGQSNYVATKAAVIGMTKVWARELGPRGITANAVAPGFIGTAMVRAMPDAVLARMAEQTPVRRLGEAGDIARAYLFLASEGSGFINGAVLSVDGGLVVGT